jgi:hypothetical protein
MGGKMTTDPKTLKHHLTAIKEGKRCFENAFQSVSRMILESKIDKVVVNGKTTYDFSIFRNGSKHVIGMYDEINSFVSYVKDAAEGGSSKEMAFVLVGEPGNGKTFFVEYLATKYRNFLTKAENRKYTFKFLNLEKLGNYGKIKAIESQTYEDPMILAMNLFDDLEETKSYLAKMIGFSDEEIEKLYENYRPLGACSGYIWNDIRSFTDGKIEEMLKLIEITPVPLTKVWAPSPENTPPRIKLPLRPSIYWGKSPSSGCCTLQIPTIPIASIFGAARWPGLPAAAFISATKYTKIKRIWFRSTWASFKIATSKLTVLNGPLIR